MCEFFATSFCDPLISVSVSFVFGWFLPVWTGAASKHRSYFSTTGLCFLRNLLLALFGDWKSTSCKRTLLSHNDVKLWACNSRLEHPCAREFGSVHCIIEFTCQTFIRVGLYKRLFRYHRVNEEFDFKHFEQNIWTFASLQNEYARSFPLSELDWLQHIAIFLTYSKEFDLFF